ncbi:tRNA pseudouridine(55) synthase TruB [Deltaproteobacteria bacterium TL4]
MSLYVINIDKPLRWTSNDVVRFLKRKLKEKKIGHLGTLDPLATGVLPVFIGKATKLISVFNHTEKTYRAILKLGESTNTFDAEGTVLEKKEVFHLSEAEIKNVISKYQGRLIQSTPAYSAIKIEGVPAYRLARQGKEVPCKQKEVWIHDLELEEITLPLVRIKVTCSKGTYIRSLANDIGKDLNVGAHLFALQRLACGTWFTMENSCTIEALEAVEDHRNLPYLNPATLLAHLHTVVVDSKMRDHLGCGRFLEISPQCLQLKHELMEDTSSLTKAIDQDQKLIAIGNLIQKPEYYQFNPSKIFI